MKYLLHFLFVGFFVFLFSFEGKAQVSMRKGLQEVYVDSAKTAQFKRDFTYFDFLDSLHTHNNYKPIFNSLLSREYLAYLKNTAAWGFNLDKYSYQKLDSLYHQKNLASKIAFEFLACESYLLLYADVAQGILKTEAERGKNFHFALEKVNLQEQLYNLSTTQSLDYLKLAEPNASSYWHLKQVLENYYFQVEDNNEQALVFSDSLKLGYESEAIILLRSKLYFFGDLPNNNRAKVAIYDKPLRTALLHFQKRNVLKVTGQLDAATLQALNKTKSTYMEELQLNLERWRWLPNFMPNYYAFANLPAFEVRLIKNDSLLLAQNMVCGKVGRNTPAFMDTMTYIDVNPTWTVPPTILQNDILPAAKRSSTYLAKKNIKVLNVATGKYVSSSSINWANAKNYKFIQGPGLSNSLGIVKFIFPNDYYIFFHDTPHKEHFELSSRAYSSGCVRLSQPLAFAEALLHYNATQYSRSDLDDLVASQKTKRILLDEQPVVFIHYLTQEFKEGVLYNYPDVYAYNAGLAKNFYEAIK